ncbi:hypothetical protein PPYR_01878 [Photinus pyralis]|uniref:DDE Tnp4 domain-containing protein n=1 Tax=Photinus pyralis TaxID=7054 RepID=A0A5N4B5T4_PHOPY|nr:hypothetical protein PPYR_01878 [Photinus pyralis]
MEVEDEIILDDDHDFLEIIEFGFPRKFYQRPNFFEEMDDLNFLKRFRLTKQATMSVLELIENQLEFENDLSAIMLGDSGYGLKQYLLTPLLNPITRPQQLYNESHIRTRNCIERTNGVWKRRFPVLCYGLRCEMETGLTIIVATAVLHNIAINMRDDVPPPPNDINAEELDYLIAQGQIPVINVNENINYDFRTDLINNHFANL